MFDVGGLISYSRCLVKTVRDQNEANQTTRISRFPVGRLSPESRYASGAVIAQNAISTHHFVARFACFFGSELWYIESALCALSFAGAPFVPPTLSYQVPRRHPRHRDCLLGAREVGASHSRFRRHPPSPAPGLRGVAASSASHGYFSMSTTPFVVPAGVSLKIAQAVRGVITRVLRCGYVLELRADAGWPYLVDHRSIAGVQSGF